MKGQSTPPSSARHEILSRPRIAAKLAEFDGRPLPPDPHVID
jgi:hypothetical protein